MALLGAILPVWGYHRDPPAFVAVGNYFLSLAVGLAASPAVAWRLLGRRLLHGRLLLDHQLVDLRIAEGAGLWW